MRTKFVNYTIQQHYHGVFCVSWNFFCRNFATNLLLHAQSSSFPSTVILLTFRHHKYVPLNIFTRLKRDHPAKINLYLQLRILRKVRRLFSKSEPKKNTNNIRFIAVPYNRYKYYTKLPFRVSIAHWRVPTYIRNP